MSGPRTDSRTERVRRRLAGRFVGALIVGPVIGLLIGGLITAVVVDARGSAAVGIMVAAVVACTVLGLLVAGYSSLESPDPGREPSDTLRPIADRPSLVRDERGDPLETTPVRGLDDTSDG